MSITTLLQEIFYGREVELKKKFISDDSETTKKTTEWSEEMPVGEYSQQIDGKTATPINEKSSIDLYRRISEYPEINRALEEIVNEAIASDPEDKIVKINCSKIPEKLQISKDTVDKITEEFDNILSLMDFENIGDEIFMSWYIDGRICYEVVVKKDNVKDGIVKLNRIDPVNITFDLNRKTKKVFPIYTPPKENLFQASYFMTNFEYTSTKIPTELIVFVGSGLYDRITGRLLSYLHRSIKAINNLRLIEDCIIIYRLIRAPEKRVYAVDVGYLPKVKAEEYMKQLAMKFKNNIIYDASSGTLLNERNVIATTEDIWLPKTADGRGTTVDTLSGGENLGELDDLYYFLKKVYESMRIPTSRLGIEEKSVLNFGRTTEIERDEVNFSKFISKVRRKFSKLFLELLRRQLLFKGICDDEDFQSFGKFICFEFSEDNLFKEIKEAELERMRIERLQMLDPYVGRFFTDDELAINVLKLSEQEWEEKKKKLKKLKEEQNDSEQNGENEVSFGKPQGNKLPGQQPNKEPENEPEEI